MFHELQITNIKKSKIFPWKGPNTHQFLNPRNVTGLATPIICVTVISILKKIKGRAFVYRTHVFCRLKYITQLVSINEIKKSISDCFLFFLI